MAGLTNCIETPDWIVLLYTNFVMLHITYTSFIQTRLAVYFTTVLRYFCVTRYVDSRYRNLQKIYEGDVEDLLGFCEQTGTLLRHRNDDVLY